jgi:hypothetical protein
MALFHGLLVKIADTRRIGFRTAPASRLEPLGLALNRFPPPGLKQKNYYVMKAGNAQPTHGETRKMRRQGPIQFFAHQA